MEINLQQWGTLVGALMVIGAILKHAVPGFPTRFIPLVTLILSLGLYLAITDGWAHAQQWIEAIIAAATATGLHSGIKNIYQEVQP